VPGECPLNQKSPVAGVFLGRGGEEQKLFVLADCSLLHRGRGCCMVCWGTGAGKKNFRHLYVDGELIYQTAHSPQDLLGFVCQLDNQ
jgi:hypothetical protein